MNKYLFTALSLTPLVPMTDGWGATKKQPSAEEQKRPNIILFMVDDMGMAGYLAAFLDTENSL